jgi:hypothetical protein
MNHVSLEAALTRLDARIGKLERDSARVQWAVTTNVGLTLIILAKLFLG